MTNAYSKNIQIVLDILQNEVDGDVSSARKKMTDDYTMTWVYRSRDGELFPTSSPNPKKEMEEIYKIENRKYEIYHIAETDNTVMVELIESYPDSKTKKIYRTPLVIVLELIDGKIRSGRHYTDPTMSYDFLSKENTDEIYKPKREPILTIS